jgi:hypothetical protein
MFVLFSFLHDLSKQSFHNHRVDLLLLSIEKRNGFSMKEKKKKQKLTVIFTSVASLENSNVRTCPAVPATMSVSVFVHRNNFCMAKRGSSQ